MQLTQLDTRVPLSVEAPQINFNQLTADTLGLYDNIKQRGQQGILSRLLAQNTNAQGEVNLGNALAGVRNQPYAPQLTGVLSSAIQAQNVARAKAALDLETHNASINKSNAESAQSLSTANKNASEMNLSQVSATAPVFDLLSKGSPTAALQQAQSLVLRRLMSNEEYASLVQNVNAFKDNPDKLAAYGQNMRMSLIDPKYSLADANTLSNNAQSDVNNQRTTQASIYGTDVGAQTADKNRAQQGQQFQQNFAFNEQKQYFEQNKPSAYGVDTQGRKYAIVNGQAFYVKDQDGGYVVEQVKSNPSLTSQKEEAQRIQRVDTILPEIEKILPQATSSYLGAGLDMAGRVVGYSSDGSEATARLKTLAGQLVSLMPKMSGPQSDKDVAMYKDMAGNLSDDTLPVKTRMAALQSIHDLNAKYKSMNQSNTAKPQDTFNLFD